MFFHPLQDNSVVALFQTPLSTDTALLIPTVSRSCAGILACFMANKMNY